MTYHPKKAEKQSEMLSQMKRFSVEMSTRLAENLWQVCTRASEVENPGQCFRMMYPSSNRGMQSFWHERTV